MLDFDVVVVGGGPAGAFSALECSRKDLDVLLMEGKGRDGHKPCGGVLTPVCSDIILETLGTNIPKNVFCSPETLGLFYVPPSGRRYGGCIENYRLLNVNRDLFDRWLREFVEGLGVQVCYETEFLYFQSSQPFHVFAKNSKRTINVTARYLIGADGAYSKVRKQLYGAGVNTLKVLQEEWRAKGDLDNDFYAFFRREVSPTYAYVVPKNGLYLLGVGVPEKGPRPASERIRCFREWLAREFAFEPLSLERREAWPIPYGFTLEGKGDIILVGDAAGFCNALSGEGIRLAMESGVAAGKAVQEAMLNGRSLAMTYANHVEWITGFVKHVYEFVTGLRDEDMEDFVRSELARTSLV